MPPLEWDFKAIWQWFGLVWLYLVTPISFYWFVLRRHPRPKPDGYVGRFERPDGRIVHVLRFNGDLMVGSEEPPGVEVKDLGNVSGRELAHWHKISSTPDGDNGIPRPD